MIFRSRRVFALFLSLAALPLFAAAEATPHAGVSLKEQLSPEDFEKAGLNKLSPAELAHLQELVSLKSGPVVSEDQPVKSLPQGEAAFGQDAELQRKVVVLQKIPDEIRSPIRGEFHGWSGSTRFELENGQIWRQSEHGTFVVRQKSATAIITRGALGSYFLRIDGYNTRTKVVRVK
jgi:hypothetical protein